MRRLSILVLVLLLSSAAPAGAETLRIHLVGDRIWLYAENAPLSQILEHFASRGVVVRADPAINPSISVSYSNQELTRGLQRIFRDLNYALAWESVKGPLGPLSRLVEIQVFEQGGRGRMRVVGGVRKFDVVKGPGGALYVRDQVMIRFKPGTTAEEAQKILASIGGTILGGNPRTGVYLVSLPQGTDVFGLVEELNHTGIIEKAEPNWAYPAIRPVGVTTRVHDAPQGDTSDLPRGSAAVAILDSGLSSTAGLEGLVVGSLDAVAPDQFLSDNLGHGTQMALIAAGRVKPIGAEESLAMENAIIPIRAFDDEGVTTNFTIMRAVDYAVASGARVINLSWGSETESAFLEDALATASNQGVVLVAAAGNEPTGNKVYPAAYSMVVGVGARNPVGGTWENSNYGESVSVLAPGFADLPVGYEGDPGTYAGTSIASAFVSSVIAHTLSQNPDASTREIMNAVANSF